MEVDSARPFSHVTSAADRDGHDDLLFWQSVLAKLIAFTNGQQHKGEKMKLTDECLATIDAFVSELATNEMTESGAASESSCWLCEGSCEGDCKGTCKDDCIDTCKDTCKGGCNDQYN